jgi:predicted ester cyclase
MKKLSKTPNFLLFLILTVTVLGGITCTSRKSTANYNIKLARQVNEEMWSKGNLAIADEICAKDIIRHAPDGSQLSGLDAFKQYTQATRNIFPDWTVTVEEVIASGDLVATKLMIRGTQTGPLPFPGNVPPTGKKAETPCALFIRIGSEKKIAEIWAYYDEKPFIEAMRSDTQSNK